MGEKGPPGDKGPVGDRGEDGPPGDKGPVGDEGEKGLPGDKGPVGDRGEKGLPGDRGPAGSRGEKGLPGDKGPIGDRGEKGPPGDKGPFGDQGEKGLPGDKGALGDQGIKTSDRWKLYLDEWSVIVESKLSVSQEFDKVMIALPTGSIALSVTVLWNIKDVPKELLMLYLSWGLLGTTVVMMLASMVACERAFNQDLDNHNNEYRAELTTKPFERSVNNWNAWTLAFEVIGIVTFVIGAGCLIRFAAVNVPSGKQQSDVSSLTIKVGEIIGLMRAQNSKLEVFDQRLHAVESSVNQRGNVAMAKKQTNNKSGSGGQKSMVEGKKTFSPGGSVKPTQVGNQQSGNQSQQSSNQSQQSGSQVQQSGNQSQQSDNQSQQSGNQQK